MIILVKEQSLSGLSSECARFLSDLNVISDPLNFSKGHWNKLIKQKIHEKNSRDLLTRIKSYSKLEHIKFDDEEYGLKPYLENMNLKDSRILFASRCRMLHTVQCNFKQKPEYIANGHKCICLEDDKQSHLSTCSSYRHLRDGLDLESDTDLVKYYQRVIREREENEERERP